MIKDFLKFIKEELNKVKEYVLLDFKEFPAVLNIENILHFSVSDDSIESYYQVSKLKEKEEEFFRTDTIHVHMYLEYKPLLGKFIFSDVEYLIPESNNDLNKKKALRLIDILKKNILETIKNNIDKNFELISYVTITSLPIEFHETLFKRTITIEAQFEFIIQYKSLF